jgi:restriction system protein
MTEAFDRCGHRRGSVAVLGRVLERVLAAPPFRLGHLMREAVIAPFNLGPLAVPVMLPDPRAYHVPSPSGLRGLSPGGRREHQEAARQAQAQLEQDTRNAAAAEERRQRQLADYHRQYQDWADRERQRIAAWNAEVQRISDQMTLGDPAALREYFTAALYASSGWPDDFPRAARVDWDPAERHLLVDWELPGFAVVPAVARYWYIKADDRETEITRPAGERKALYRGVLAQCGLAVLAEVLRIDVRRLAATVIVNGFVTRPDPATGRRAKAFLLTVTAGRPDLSRVDLARADPVACLDGLRGQLSPRPEQLAPVCPARLAAAPGGEPDDGAGGEAAEVSLLDMDPVDFEDLVAELFRQMGWQVMTTARSGDGGVDVQAMDPDPIRGGKIVIQVKRYRHAIPPAFVRDLYGTMLHEGATRGILVTTAEPGPSAQAFAAGKPLTLIGGRQLTSLLADHGIGHYAIR